MRLITADDFSAKINTYGFSSAAVAVLRTEHGAAATTMLGRELRALSTSGKTIIGRL